MADVGSATRAHDVRHPDAFAQLLELEPDAEHIFLNQPLFLPGLLQLPGYAAGMISGITGLKPGSPELEARVQVRMQRADAFRQRLRSDSPPHIWAAIDESVVRRKVGGAEAMREQLLHLLAMCDVGTVRLGIIPFDHGAYPGLGGSFEVHELANGDASVYFEGQHEALVAGDPERAGAYRDLVKSMVASGSDARAMLEELTRTS